jgi:hypothetical protein
LSATPKPQFRRYVCLAAGRCCGGEPPIGSLRNERGKAQLFSYLWHQRRNLPCSSTPSRSCWRSALRFQPPRRSTTSFVDQTRNAKSSRGGRLTRRLRSSMTIGDQGVCNAPRGGPTARRRVQGVSARPSKGRERAATVASPLPAWFTSSPEQPPRTRLQLVSPASNHTPIATRSPTVAESCKKDGWM